MNPKIKLRLLYCAEITLLTLILIVGWEAIQKLQPPGRWAAAIILAYMLGHTRILKYLGPRVDTLKWETLKVWVALCWGLALPAGFLLSLLQVALNTRNILLFMSVVLSAAMIWVESELCFGETSVGSTAQTI